MNMQKHIHSMMTEIVCFGILSFSILLKSAFFVVVVVVFVFRQKSIDLGENFENKLSFFSKIFLQKSLYFFQIFIV